MSIAVWSSRSRQKCKLEMNIAGIDWERLKQNASGTCWFRSGQSRAGEAWVRTHECPGRGDQGGDGLRPLRPAQLALLFAAVPLHS